MGRTRLGVLITLTLGAWPAWSQNVVFRCVDESGRMQYTNVQTDMAGRQCQIVQGEVSVVPGSTPASTARKPPAPAQQQATANRDSAAGRETSRRRILEEELAQEEQLLQKARADLTAQEATRGGDERNYQKVLDRLKPFQDTVDRHARNVDALKKELAAR